MVDARFATKDDLDELREELRAEVRGVAVLVERNGSDMRAMLEGMSAMRDGLTRQMTDMEERLSSRIEALEAVVRSHSSDLRGLTTEVAALRLRFDRRDVQLEELEKRVAATEKRLGIKG